MFDSWYAKLENLKLIRSFGWQWLTRLELTAMSIQTGREIASFIRLLSLKQAVLVHLKGYGMIKVFKIVRTDADIEYWATSDLT